MKRYLMTVDITEAVGTQTFAVEAESAEEARAAVTSGKGEIVSEEVEVQGLAWHTAVIEEDK